MAEKRTIARPYAKALFALALERKQLGAGSRALAVCSTVVTHEGVKKLLSSPHVAPAQLADLVIDIAEQVLEGDALEEQGCNFIRTLAANRRLGFLPEIAAIFDMLKAQWENTADVTVISAIPLDAQLQRHYTDAMQKRLRREVRLHCEVDPALLGGAILRADDLVIDGSLRGRLERLAADVTG